MCVTIELFYKRLMSIINIIEITIYEIGLDQIVLYSIDYFLFSVPCNVIQTSVLSLIDKWLYYFVILNFLNDSRWIFQFNLFILTNFILIYSNYHSKFLNLLIPITYVLNVVFMTSIVFSAKNEANIFLEYFFTPNERRLFHKVNKSEDYCHQ